MKILFLITFSFIINIYSQFTSGTDYSAKTAVKEEISEAGVIIYSIKSDVKWEIANSDISFDSNSNMTGFGYGLFLSLPSDCCRIIFNAGHIYRDITNSASKKDYVTPGEDPVYSNIDVEDFSMNQIRAEARIEMNNRYIISSGCNYITEGDENSLQFGGSAEYKASLKNRQFITAGIEMNSEGNDDLLRARASYTDNSPYQHYSAGFIKEFETAKINSKINFLKYYSSAVNARETDYFNFVLGYDMSFKTAGTNVSISAGSNLTKDFTTPSVNLPYFYYKVIFGTEFLNNRIGMNIGWDYGMYEVVLSDRVTVPENELLLLPAGVEDISENIGSYTFDIKLSYRF